MYKKDIFNRLIPYNSFWTRLDDSFKALSVGSGEKYIISDAELAQIHPSLPHGLAFLIDDDQVRSKSEIETMLQMWDCTTRVVRQYESPVIFFSVDSVEVCSEDVYISGNGSATSTKIIPETGEDIIIPAGFVDQVSLFKMWMNEQFPEWKKRFNIASDLGLSPQMIVESMLEVPSEFKVEIPPDDVVPF